MRVICRQPLREFWEAHPQAREPLLVWFRLMKRSQFHNLSALKRSFAAVDCVPPFTVFNVGGSTFQLITAIRYSRACVYLRDVFTHAEYSQWSDQRRKGPRKAHRKDPQ